MNKWISVNDKLSEIGQTVMCFRKWQRFGDKLVQTNDVISLKYTDEIYGRPFFMDRLSGDTYNVEYWQYIPTPPLNSKNNMTQSYWKKIEKYSDYPESPKKVLFRETRTIECYWNGKDLVRNCDPFDFNHYKPIREWKDI